VYAWIGSQASKIIAPADPGDRIQPCDSAVASILDAVHAGL